MARKSPEAEFDYRIGRLEVKPGDVVVIKVACRLTDDAAATLREMFKRAMPGVKALLLDDSVDISVLSRAEIDAKTA